MKSLARDILRFLLGYVDLVGRLIVELVVVRHILSVLGSRSMIYGTCTVYALFILYILNIFLFEGNKHKLRGPVFCSNVGRNHLSRRRQNFYDVDPEFIVVILIVNEEIVSSVNGIIVNLKIVDFVLNTVDGLAKSPEYQIVLLKVCLVEILEVLGKFCECAFVYKVGFKPVGDLCGKSIKLFLVLDDTEVSLIANRPRLIYTKVSDLFFGITVLLKDPVTLKQACQRIAPAAAVSDKGEGDVDLIMHHILRCGINDLGLCFSLISIICNAVSLNLCRLFGSYHGSRSLGRLALRRRCGLRLGSCHLRLRLRRLGFSFSGHRDLGLFRFRSSHRLICNLRLCFCIYGIVIVDIFRHLFAVNGSVSRNRMSLHICHRGRRSWI